MWSTKSSYVPGQSQLVHLQTRDTGSVSKSLSPFKLSEQGVSSKHTISSWEASGAFGVDDGDGMMVTLAANSSSISISISSIRKVLQSSGTSIITRSVIPWLADWLIDYHRHLFNSSLGFRPWRDSWTSMGDDDDERKGDEVRLGSERRERLSLLKFQSSHNNEGAKEKKRKRGEQWVNCENLLKRRRRGEGRERKRGKWKERGMRGMLSLLFPSSTLILFFSALLLLFSLLCSSLFLSPFAAFVRRESRKERKDMPRSNCRSGTSSSGFRFRSRIDRVLDSIFSLTLFTTDTLRQELKSIECFECCVRTFAPSFAIHRQTSEI